MRVSREKAAQNRAAILDAASRLFRRRGIDGVGVAEIAREAGLTHGALYAHFPSKEALVEAAFTHGFVGNMARGRARAGDRQPAFEEHLDALLSRRMRDDWETGCPLAASASEAGRQSTEFSACFARAVAEMTGMLEASLEEGMPAETRRRLALVAIAGEIGAVAVSRALVRTDPGLADEVLQLMKEALSESHKHAAMVSARAGAARPGARASRSRSR